MISTPVFYGKENADGKYDAIIIENKSPVPNNILAPIVKNAAEFIGVKGTIVLSVRSGRTVRGVAYGKDVSKIVVPMSTKEGYSFRHKEYNNPIDVAVGIYGVIAHEFFHNLDFQNGDLIRWQRYSKHNDRVCEVRANEAKDKALLQMPRDLLNELIDWMTEYKNQSLARSAFSTDDILNNRMKRKKMVSIQSAPNVISVATPVIKGFAMAGK